MCEGGSWLYGGVGASPAERYTAFFGDAEARLRRALVAAYGTSVGREAAAEAMAFAWERWGQVEAMANPVGYLYRVGQSRARRLRKPVLAVVRRDDASSPWVEPALAPALQSLSEHQRVAVVLCHGFGWTQREVADLLGIGVTTVQNHVERGLVKLRRLLEVSADA